MPGTPITFCGGRTVEDVDNRAEVRDFLTSRRERLSPDQVGLDAGGTRRVKGLRRGEVAVLAGVSVEYFTRLERGNLTGVSEAVLDALSRALRLDEAERTHLFDLARAANATGSARRKAATPPRLRPGIQRVLDGMSWPAWVRNGCADFIASNHLARALYSPVFDDPYRPANTARFAFLNPRARAFYVDWDQTANDVVAALHAEAGRNPYDKGLTDLIGELSTRSEDFRTRWAKHNVHSTAAGTSASTIRSWGPWT